MLLKDEDGDSYYLNTEYAFRKPVELIKRFWDTSCGVERTQILYQDGSKGMVSIDMSSHDMLCALAEERESVEWKENLPLSSVSKPLRPLKVLTES